MITIGTRTESQQTTNNPTFSAVIDVGTTMLVLTIHSMSNGGIGASGATCGGVGMTLQKDTGSSVQARTIVFTLANPPTGSQTIAVTSSPNASSKLGLEAICILGSGTTVDDAQAGGMGVAVTTLTDHSIIIGSVTRAENSVVLSGPLYDETVLENQNFGLNEAFGDSYFIKPTAGVFTTAWNYSAGNNTGSENFVGIVIPPAAANLSTPVTIDTSLDLGNTTATTLTGNITTAGLNEVLLVGVLNTGQNSVGGHSLGSCGVDGHSATLLGFIDGGAVDYVLGLYWAIGLAPGVHSLLITNVAGETVRAIAVSLNGANNVNNYGSQSSTTAALSKTITSATDNMVVDFAYNVNSSETKVTNQNYNTSTEPYKSTYKEAGASQGTMSWTLGGANPKSALVMASVVAGLQPQILNPIFIVSD